MTKYVLLYSGGMPDSQEEQDRMLQPWIDWYDGLGEALLDPGNPFTPTVKRIASNGAVSDGPVDGMLTGYTLINAGSFDEAVQMARKCPILKANGQISVFETFEMT